MEGEYGGGAVKLDLARVRLAKEVKEKDRRIEEKDRRIEELQVPQLMLVSVLNALETYTAQVRERRVEELQAEVEGLQGESVLTGHPHAWQVRDMRVEELQGEVRAKVNQIRQLQNEIATKDEDSRRQLEVSEPPHVV